MADTVVGQHWQQYFVMRNRFAAARISAGTKRMESVSTVTAKISKNRSRYNLGLVSVGNFLETVGSYMNNS